MSETIKIGDFIERLNNLDFKTGTKIKFQDKIYLYDYPNLTGIYEIGKPTKREYSIFAQLDITNLHSPVEIIEEQEEIDIQNMEILDNTVYDHGNMTKVEIDNYHNYTRTIVSQLVQAVKQLDKNIKEK